MPVVVDVSRESADLLALLAKVERGEEVVVAREGEPIARLVALRPRGQRRFGALRGRVSLDDRFFEPLPPEELAAWEELADSDTQEPPELRGTPRAQASAPADRKPLLAPNRPPSTG